MKKLFGTDGIRGVANHYPLDPNTVMRAGWAIATYFRQQSGASQLVVGRDTRLSGNMIECALVAGINSAGVGVVHLGVMPTAAVAHFTRTLPAIAGIMVSASHNSFEDNGIKVFQSTGCKCDDRQESEIEALILQPEDPACRPTGAGLGRITGIEDAAQKYRELITRHWPRGLDLRGTRLALDTANGAAYETAPAVLRALGAEVFPFHHEPNGININLDCGSTHPHIIQRETQLTQAQLGIALDGDADRIACCDELGQIVDGDEIMAILALDLMRRGELAQNTLVATTQSNLGLDECLKAAGGQVLRTEVGDRYVLAAMLERGLNFGGEQSGHVIFRDYMTTSDGLLTALQLLRIMREQNQPLSQLRTCLKKYPQVLRNIPVREKRPLAEMPSVHGLTQAAEQELGGRGRIQFRYSGTEKKARILVEGPDQAQAERLADQVAEALRGELGCYH
jgi:phosphoglucosamine mutase